MQVEALQRLDPDAFFRKFVASKVRPDGRAFNAVRDLAISTGVLGAGQVESSGLVRIGKTKMLAAITLQAGQPAEATPNCGDMEVQVLLTPMSSSSFFVGRPSEQAQALEMLIRDVFVGSQAVKLTDLSIETGKVAWKVCVDILCLSFDGNLTDAALLATAAALLTLKLPPTVLGENGELAIIEGDGIPLPIYHVPIPLSFGIFDGVILTDLTKLEESLVATQITIVQSIDGIVCAVRKAGGASVTGAQLAKCFVMSKGQAKSVLAHMPPILKTAEKKDQ